MTLFGLSQNKKSDLALVMCPGWGVSQPPVGISYLKSFLGAHGISTQCFDFSLELYKQFPEKKFWDLNHPEYFINPTMFTEYIQPTIEPDMDRWAEKILKLNPKAVGFSLFMSSINASVLLAKKIKSLNPKILVIAGGAEATRIKRAVIDKITPLSTLNKESLDVFDLLIDGEGEQTILEIMHAFSKKQDYQAIPGVFYKQNDMFFANTPRRLLDDLNSLPAPDFRDFTLDAYEKTTLPIVTSRGCVNKCTFCADSPLWKTYRCQKAEKVLEDLKILIARHGIDTFEIVDSSLNGDINRVNGICTLLIDSKIDINWSAKVRIADEMTYPLLKKMKTAGCCSLSYGIESGSPRVLEDMRKNIDIEKAKQVIRDTQRAGIETNCFFIIGYPTETEADFQLTLDFIAENAEFIHRFDQITGCHIEEDSYLGRNLDKYGITFKEDGWYAQANTPSIRKQRLEKFRNLARKVHKHYTCEVQS